MADEEKLVAVCGLMLFSLITATTIFCANGTEREKENVESTGSSHG